MSLQKLFLHIQFFIKYILYYGFTGFISFILLPYFILHPMDVENQLLYAKFSVPLIPLIGLSYEIRGKEHLAEDRAGIIVANHQSGIDVAGMVSAAPIVRKYKVVAKKLLFYGWPIGLAFWLCGCIYIDKNNWEKNSKILDVAIKNCKEKKIKVWIFPEGSRHHEGGIHDFRKGAFYMAIKHQLPILPVVYSKYYFLSLKDKIFDSGKVIMTALPAIQTKGLEMKDMQELMNKTRLLMIEAYNSMNEELRASLDKNQRRS